MGEDTDAFFRRIFKSGSIVLIGFGCEIVISLLGKVIVARFLGPANYGAIAIGATLLSTVPVFALLGVNKGVGRFLPRFEDERRRRGVLISAFQISLPLSIAAAAVLFSLANPLATTVFDSPDLARVIRIFALAVPFLAVTQVSLGAIQGIQRTLPRVYIKNLSTPLLRLVLIGVAIYFGLQAMGIAWAYTLARILPAILGVYFLYRLTPLFSRNGYFPMRRQLLTFSAPMVVASAMSRIMSDLDTYLLGYFINIRTVGVYNVIYPIMTSLGIPLMAFGYLTLPTISELHANDQYEEMRELYQGVTKWIVLLSLPILGAVFLFPGVVIGTTFGTQYLSGKTALRILTVLPFVTALTGPVEQIITSIGETRRLLYYNVIAVTVNVILNVLLIPPFKLLGAAAATVVSFGFLNILITIRMYRTLALQPLTKALVWPSLFGTVTFGGISAGVLAMTSPSPVTIIVSVVVFMPIYMIGIVWFGAIEHQEMMIVKSVEDRFGINLEPVKSVIRRLR